MMVNLAAQARFKNVSQDDVFLQVITQKEDILGENTNTSCTKEHINKKESQHLFDSIDFRMNKTKIDVRDDVITEVDIKVGLKMYYLSVFCNSEASQITHFLANMTLAQSPRTLLLAIVNTLQSNEISWRAKVFLGDVYQAVEEMFHLKLAKILLAISTPSQLMSIMDQDLPFLYTVEQTVKVSRRV